ncbi:DoxX family protein [Brevibacterium casei]|uniref:DoxX family protein n=2 Tax=Brevibacterium casei TaxID=33889 RepID=UPI003CC90BCA
MVTSLLWAGHWLLRLWLAGYLLIYGWSKVFHMQMGYADFADALVQYGEMSPMGLLWRFMAFSPTVQLLAGLAEVAAAVLLLFRRTAWLGALLAAIDMSVVFLLNLTFDVPVKQLSGLMALVGLILLLPNIVRLGRFVVGLPTGPPVQGTITENRRFRAVVRWASPLLALVLVVGSGLALGLRANWGQPDAPSAIAGVYRVTDVGQRTFAGSEISQVAFGQIAVAGRARAAIRYTDGTYQDGMYSLEDGSTVTLSLYPKRNGDQGLIRDVETTISLAFVKAGSGDLRLSGEGLWAAPVVRSGLCVSRRVPFRGCSGEHSRPG